MATPPLPNFQDFCTSISLYQAFTLDSSDSTTVFDLFHNPGTVDCYCPYCGEKSIFSLTRIWSTNETTNRGMPAVFWSMLPEENHIHVNGLTCSRKSDHRIYFIFQIVNNKLSKIGQYPSHADLTSDELKKFSKVIDKQVLEELKKAHYLFAHGIGVGAFAYLRRVVEIYVIRDAYEQANKSEDWNEEEYLKLRVGERIKLLKPYLPSIFVDNAVVYGIISKGIHELNEEDCKQYFPVLNTFLMVVLTKIKAAKETADQEKELQRQIQAMASESKR